MAGLAFFYLFVYRRFFAKKSVMNSAIYHQTINFLRQNQTVQKQLGQHIQIMNCNGKISPLTSHVDFDLLVFGSQQKGKFCVKTEYDKKTQQWTIHGVELFTKSDKI